MARDLGVTQPTIWRWLNQSKQLPAEHVLTAESLYGVSRHDLRPDIYPRDYPPAPEARWLGIDQIDEQIDVALRMRAIVLALGGGAI